eukprot:20800-Eustigmatos_ZCMA.PRE.1
MVGRRSFLWHVPIDYMDAATGAALHVAYRSCGRPVSWLVLRTRQVPQVIGPQRQARPGHVQHNWCVKLPWCSLVVP